MSSQSVAAVPLLHEQRLIERLLEDPHEEAFADVFKILAPRLVAFFRAQGCRSIVAENLAQKAMCEITTRVREILRETGGNDSFEPLVIQIGDLKIDRARRLLWRGDSEIHLTPKEFDLLAFMMKNSDVVLPHVKLLRSVWGLEYGGETEYLRTYVRALRKKIEKNPSDPEYLVCVPWFGYRFRRPGN